MKTLSLYITTVANMRGLLHWYQFVSIILFLIFYLGFVALYNRLKKINRDSWIDSILHFYLAIIEHEVWLFLPIWWYRYINITIYREKESLKTQFLKKILFCCQQAYPCNTSRNKLVQLRALKSDPAWHYLFFSMHNVRCLYENSISKKKRKEYRFLLLNKIRESSSSVIRLSMQ